MSSPHPLRFGFALGSGSARGWAHIGVIAALAELGIEPDIVCGTSMGAVVAAACASSRLGPLLEAAEGLTRLRVARFVNVSLAFNNFVDPKRLADFLQPALCDETLAFSDLQKKFAAVATDLETGKELWLTEGRVFDAVSASIALPGLLPPTRLHGRWLVDGGLVNPVPVSLCRALGADVVIAVNLNAGIVGSPIAAATASGPRHRFLSALLSRRAATGEGSDVAVAPPPRIRARAPRLLDVLGRSINITQDRITRSRMAGDPPDIVLTPRLSQIGLFEFHRVAEAVHEGRQCVARMLPEIRHLLADISG